MPKFSIIIPVYNVAPYLCECLDSVLAAAQSLNVRMFESLNVNSQNPQTLKPSNLQTLKPSNTLVEVICVDDGSTDGSGAILDEYVEKLKIENEKCKIGNGVKFVVIHQANAGVSAARNAALDVATGEWICFVDADDAVRRSYLEDFISFEHKSDINFMPVRYNYEDGSVKVCAGPDIQRISDSSQIELYCIRFLRVTSSLARSRQIFLNFAVARRVFFLIYYLMRYVAH